MMKDTGYLSIDFLAGFTVFMLAFIWVATMIPGILIGISGHAIDYDAVAYRSGVILVEDPGMPSDKLNPWEIIIDEQKDEVLRMGLALNKETPNILSPVKISRFFCTTAFVYPDDYQQRVIFGDRPYRFNISVMTFDGSINQSLGDIRPLGYGYIRRFVKIKQMSNATIDAFRYNSSTNSTVHIFSVSINMSHLVLDEKRPEYQIDALHEQVVINITNLRSNLLNPANGVNLTTVKLYRNPQAAGSNWTEIPNPQKVYVDGGSTLLSPPVPVRDNVSMMYPSYYFGLPTLATDQSKFYVNFTFTLSEGDRFINSTFGNRPFDYDYNQTRVTQPRLEPGIVEVAVW